MAKIFNSYRKFSLNSGDGQPFVGEIKQPFWKNRFKLGQLAGSFQPFISLGKDFVDTFKPYRSRYQRVHDFFQPLIGLFNILVGIGILVLSPLVLLSQFIGGGIVFLNKKFPGEIDRGKSLAAEKETFKEFVTWQLVKQGSWVIQAINEIFRGATQIAATPLTWFIKMPLRDILTLYTHFAKKENFLFENRPGIKSLISKGQAMLNTEEEFTHKKINSIIKTLEKKYYDYADSSFPDSLYGKLRTIKERLRHEETNINKETMDKKFNLAKDLAKKFKGNKVTDPKHKQTYQDCLNLFKKKTSIDGLLKGASNSEGLNQSAYGSYNKA